MIKIIFYVTGHGYGHAARQQAIIRELAKQGAEVHVRSAAPHKFFDHASNHRQQATDAGMVQPYSLHVDPAATLENCKRFMATESALIAEEVAYIREHKIQIVVADISPVAFEIAEVVDLPSVLITHFTWDFVYEQYVQDYPGYRPVIEHIRGMYHKAGLVLELPFAHDFSLFSHVEKHALTINPVSQSCEDVRALLNIPEDSPLVLLSMGGHQWGNTNLAPLREMTDKTFLVQPGAWKQVADLTHFRQVPLEYDDYHNLIAAADLVVGKAGGSTVAEVIGHRTPMIYTMNHNWSENVLLQGAMDTYCNSLYIPWQDFEAGAWADHIDTLLTRDYIWQNMAIDGAERAADRLIAMATS